MIIYKLKNRKITVSINTNTFYISTNKYTYYARYPFDITYIPKHHIDLMVWILFYGYGENKIVNSCEVPECYEQSIMDKFGDKEILCFSGGIDSTAVYLINNPVPVFLKRNYDETYFKNQINICNKIKANIVENDMELIRKEYGLAQGFNIGCGYLALLIPFVFYYNARNISFGVVFDDLAFRYSEYLEYNDFSKWHKTKNMFKILKEYGINIVYPLSGLSEIYTTKIVNNSVLKDLASPCHVSMTGNYCKECFKCFRKLGVLEQQINISDKIYNILSKKPLKMACSTVYGIQKAKYNIERLKRYNDIDVSFLDRYNKDIMKYFCDSEKMQIKFKELGIEPQNENDKMLIDKFVKFINKDSFYE